MLMVTKYINGDLINICKLSNTFFLSADMALLTNSIHPTAFLLPCIFYRAG